MEVTKGSCEEWEYRAEGNFHVIVVNYKTRQVLRLPKCYRDKKTFDDLSSLEAASSELSFVRHVAHPAMRNCRACYPIHQVPLSKEFLRNVSKKVEPSRPAYRLHKVINQDCKFGILMPDFCQVLPSPPFSSGAAISVEIKPKQGFILKGHSRCRFSQFQHLKVHSKAYEKESTYCPVDLFSGCKKRMQRAIKALIQHPQNNLRIFRNGKVIYSQESIEETKSKNPKEIFKSNVLSLLCSHVGQKQGTTEKLKLASHNFQDILCSLLLYPVCDHKPNITHMPQHCSGDVISREKENKTDVIDTHDTFAHSNKSGYKASLEPRLASDCILSLLLSLQKLEDRPISDYYKMYKFTKHHLDTYPDEVSRLSLEGPYDAKQWQQVVLEICDSDNLMLGRGNAEDSWKEDVDIAASLLRKFLVATSFKDCSIMMTFQFKPQGAVISAEDIPITVKTRWGQEYWASLALVDSDPKPACRIPQYYHNASKHT